jgi:hypothetical protein
MGSEDTISKAMVRIEGMPYLRVDGMLQVMRAGEGEGSGRGWNRYLVYGPSQTPGDG